MLSSCCSASDLTPQLPGKHCAQQHRDNRHIRSSVPRCRGPSNICRDTRSQPQRADHRIRLSSDSAVATTTGDGSDGGSIATNPKFTADEDREPEGSSLADADALLAKEGAARGELPADFEAALRAGRLPLEVLRAYLRLASVPVLGALCRAFPGFRDRVLGNPRFLVVLAIEFAMGASAKWSAEVQARGDKFWPEMSFVASDMALEIIGDVAIVWFLSPQLRLGSLPSSGVARWTRSLPASAVQVGDYASSQRVAAYLWRGVQFFGLGFGSSAVGHTLTKVLVDRHERNTGEHAEKDLAPVLQNSLAWGGFLALSSNTRYQLVAGIEERVLDAMIGSPALKTGITLLLRFGNTMVGGKQWVWYARHIGLQ